jgi:hypothetical protein
VAVVGVLAGGTTLCLVPLVVGPAVPAGAASGYYTLTCKHGSTTVVIPKAVTTGTVPMSVTAGKSFTLTNYGLTFTLSTTPLFRVVDTHTVSGTYTTTVTATGATPAHTTTVLTLPMTHIETGTVLDATGPPVQLTAGDTAGKASVSTGSSGTLVLTVSGVGPINLTCTNATSVITRTKVLAPQTAVTVVSPNSGPLAGGELVAVGGTFLTGATAVDFGTTPATTVKVVTAHVITAVSPPSAAPETVDVRVTTPRNTSAVTPADHYTYTEGPVVTGVRPSSGPPAGGTAVTITGLQLTGVTAVDFGTTPAASFIGNSTTSITAVSPPGTVGTVNVTVTNPEGTSVTSLLDEFTYISPGYWTVASDGGIFSFDGAPFYGSMGGKTLNAPVVGMAVTSNGGGYWEVASDGGIFSFGNAAFYGSMGGKPLNRPIVGMTAMPTGKGYWEVASDGGIFSFGSAQFYGSMGGKALDAPVVSGAATPTGKGYWEVAADGGTFGFGNAQFYGSMGGKTLNKPIVGMATTPTGGGYWEVASDGGIFAFGNAQFYGSMGGTALDAPMVGVAAA